MLMEVEGWDWCLPLYCKVSLAISSAIFLADKPKGPTLGANDEAPAASPPKHRNVTIDDKRSNTRLGMRARRGEGEWECVLILTSAGAPASFGGCTHITTYHTTASG